MKKTISSDDYIQMVENLGGLLTTSPKILDISFGHNWTFIAHSTTVSSQEIYFKEANFPGIQEHKGLHAGFIQRIIQFKEDYEKDFSHTCKSLLPFLGEWFDDHILKYDKEAIDYLKEKGL